MRKLFILLFLAFMLGAGQETLLNSKAEAANIEIKNTVDKPLYVSVVFFNDTINSWVCKGWWTVPAASNKTLIFGAHSQDYFWVHLHTSERIWKGNRSWTVISDPFRYELNKKCPEGPNRRKIPFNKFHVGPSGIARITAK